MVNNRPFWIICKQCGKSHFKLSVEDYTDSEKNVAILKCLSCGNYAWQDEVNETSP